MSHYCNQPRYATKERMVMKELLFHVQRHLVTHRGGEEQTMEGALTIAVYMRPVSAPKDFLTAYVAACNALESGLGSMLRNRLILGASQKAITRGAITRLPGDADCASLGAELIANVCPRLISSHGFEVEMLKVAFGVFEKAVCYPDRPSEFETSFCNDDGEEVSI